MKNSKLQLQPSADTSSTGNRKDCGFQSEPKATLLVREKLAVFFILFVLVTITSMAFAQKHHRICKTKPNLSVHCMGQIKEPKTISLAYGATLLDLLAHLELTEEADLAKLVLEERLKNGQNVIIPRKNVMSLYVTGAVVKAGLVFVPEGIRFNQLKRHLDLQPEADLAIFRRRKRRLIEGETIHIPSRAQAIGEKVVVQKEKL